ncbi:MAG: hypothetical protein Tsb0020_01510 [Haliangiales bacterium]
MRGARGFTLHLLILTCTVWSGACGASHRIGAEGSGWYCVSKGVKSICKRSRARCEAVEGATGVCRKTAEAVCLRYRVVSEGTSGLMCSRDADGCDSSRRSLTSDQQMLMGCHRLD